MKKHESIAEYILEFPENIQAKLLEMKAIISKAVPNAQEVISYNMPAFKQHGVLVYFAGYKNHIGFYPTGSGIAAFANEINEYKSSKGAIQFPLSEPLPAKLITKIVRFRQQQDQEKQDLLKPKFISALSAPAQRALANAGIKTLKQLAKWNESDLLELHGLGPSAMPKIYEALAKEGLQLKQ
jgi:uncharacterized protein YdhG (YjbR/CyaY superfamily)